MRTSILLAFAIPLLPACSAAFIAGSAEDGGGALEGSADGLPEANSPASDAEGFDAQDERASHVDSGDASVGDADGAVAAREAGLPPIEGCYTINAGRIVRISDPATLTVYCPSTPCETGTWSAIGPATFQWNWPDGYVDRMMLMPNGVLTPLAGVQPDGGSQVSNAGQDSTPTTCPSVVTDAGTDAGGCTPGAARCSGLQPQLCSSSGQWTSSGSICPYACTGGACTGSAPCAASSCPACSVSGSSRCCNSSGTCGCSVPVLGGCS